MTVKLTGANSMVVFVHSPFFIHSCATIVSTAAATPAADASFSAFSSFCAPPISGPRTASRRSREKSSCEGSRERIATPCFVYYT